MRYLILILCILLISCKSLNVAKKPTIMKNAKPIEEITMTPPPQPNIEEGSDEGVVEERVVVGDAMIVENRNIGRTIASNEASLEIENATINDKVNINESKLDGMIAYSVPEKMQVGKNYIVKVRITKDTVKQTLIIGDHEIPINDPSVKSIITIESVRIAPIMSSALISPNNSFEIKALSTEFQDIEDQGYTEWSWNVNPVKSGENVLKLIVKVRIVKDGEETFKDIVVFEKNIHTKANISYSVFQFVKEQWEWLASSIVIPIFLWWFNNRKKKKKK